MDGVSRFGTNAENCLERVGSCAEMGTGSEKFERGLLFLEREIGCGNTFDLHLGRFQLKGLFCAGGENEDTARDNGGTDVELCDLCVVFELICFKNDLKSGDCTAVGEFHKAERIACADGSCPTRNGNLFVSKRFGGSVKLFDGCAFHNLYILSCMKYHSNFIAYIIIITQAKRNYNRKSAKTRI